MCTATKHYDAMLGSMLDWWDAGTPRLVEQDGGESDKPCANASHQHHRGLNDSIWRKWEAVHATYHGAIASSWLPSIRALE